MRIEARVRSIAPLEIHGELTAIVSKPALHYLSEPYVIKDSEIYKSHLLSLYQYNGLRNSRLAIRT
jgi:hypothetical protein